jgi:hypothetical protein
VTQQQRYRLAAATFRPGVVLPSGVRGRTVTAGAVVALAVVPRGDLGRVYLVHAEGQQPRYYLPHTVESVELAEIGQPKKPLKKCAICPEMHGGKGQTCSKSCAAKLRYRRAK